MARRNLWRRLWDAIRNPESYAPPDLPNVPPPVPPPAPSAPRIQRTSYIPASDLPSEWGSNKRALWQDATKTQNAMGRDPIAQSYYNAALYSHSEPGEDRAEYMRQFKDYIRSRYGIEWDEVFDWASYREAYDTAALGS